MFEGIVDKPFFIHGYADDIFEFLLFCFKWVKSGISASNVKRIQVEQILQWCIFLIFFYISVIDFS